MLRHTFFKRAFAVSLALGLASQGPAAKPPTLTSLFPAGAQRGQKAQVTAGGEFDHWPPCVWVDGAGVDVKAASDKGQLVITVSPDAPPGAAWVRLYDDLGASALRPFLIGTLPEIAETEPNDDASRPQVLETAAVTVNGRLGRTGDVDSFGASLRKGQTLVAALDAHSRLGSPMDAVLQVVSPQGFVLAQSDDDRGLDPMIVFESPADGRYVVRTFAFPSTPNATIAFAGGEGFIYRLTISTLGYVDHAYPLAAERSKPAQVELRGWNIPESVRFFTFASDDPSGMVRLSLERLANVAEVRLDAHPSIVEREPNDPEHPQPIALPVTITGRIDPERDRDVFQFAAQKGQKAVARVESRTLGLPLDPVLRLSDGSGKVLADVDDSNGGRDAELAFTAPADGDYRLSVRDLNGRGGARYVYRLTIGAPEPDFSLSLATDRVTLSPDGPVTVPIIVDRKNGFGGSIEVHAEGLPEGVTAQSVTSAPSGDTSKKVTLAFSAQRGPASGAFQIVGTSDGPHALERMASALLSGLTATTTHIWITVTKGK
jgi:hypothetical protein